LRLHFDNTLLALYEHCKNNQGKETIVKFKRITVIMVVMALVVTGVSVVGAQDDRPGENRGRPIWHGIRDVVSIVADQTGLRAVELLDQLREGKTLAEIIQSKGGDVQSVIDQAVTTLTEHINQAVTDGKLTQERADRLLSNLEELVTQAINGEFRQRAVELRAEVGVLRLAGEQTGLTPHEILQQLHSGKSLGEVLSEHGVDISAFIDTAVNALQERLDQAVNNGRITREQADERITEFRDRLTERINEIAVFEDTSVSA
jgi:hypothetical protein